MQIIHTKYIVIIITKSLEKIMTMVKISVKISGLKSVIKSYLIRLCS